MASAVPGTPVRVNQQPICNESSGYSGIKTQGLDVNSARNTTTTPVRIRAKNHHPVSDEIGGDGSSRVMIKGVDVPSTPVRMENHPVSNELCDYSSRVRTPGLMNGVMSEPFLVTPGADDSSVRDSYRCHSFCTPGGKSKAKPQQKFSKDKDCKDRSSCSTTPASTTGYNLDSGEGSVLRGAKRSLSELFSPSPAPAEKIRVRPHLKNVPLLTPDKGAAGIWSDGIKTKRNIEIEGEVDVSDDTLRSSKLDDICVIEVLLNYKSREGIQMLKSWRLGDLKRRLVLLGYFDDENLITIKTRFVETGILPDDRTIGELDKNDVIVVECV